jgi:hypothetical protein
MGTQIRNPVAGLAGMLWVGVVWAQTYSSDLGSLADYRLDRPSGGSQAFRIPLGTKAALAGAPDSLGILLFRTAPGQMTQYTRAGAHDSGEWLDAANLGPGAIANGGIVRREQREDPFELHVSGKSYYSRDDYSRRWFVMPTENWVLQFTRGHLSNFDQLESPKNIQRTTLSATYNKTLDFGVWQTTLAWGRHSSSATPNVTGYLAESSLQISGAHTFFGRMEQVRSEDLLSNNESLADPYKLNKLTAGYFYAVPTGTSSKVDLGGMVSRYSVPSSLAASYGRNPTTVLFFVRMQLQ